MGMSRAEVEAILGPAGDYRSYDSELDREHMLDGVDEFARDTTLEDTHLRWWEDGGFAFVVVSPSEEVVSKIYIVLRRVDHGPLGNLRWRLHRRWQEWFSPNK